MHTDRDERDEVKGTAHSKPIRLPEYKAKKERPSEDDDVAPGAGESPRTASEASSSARSPRSEEALSTEAGVKSKAMPESTETLVVLDGQSVPASTIIPMQAVHPITPGLAGTAELSSQFATPDLLQASHQPLSLDTIQKLFHESVLLQIKTMDVANIDRLLSADLATPETQRAFIEALEHFFSLAKTRTFGIIDLYEERKSPEEKVALCAGLQGIVRENALMMQALKLSQNMSQTADALNTLETTRSVKEQPPQENISLETTLKSLGFSSADDLRSDLAKRLAMIKNIRINAHHPESFLSLSLYDWELMEQTRKACTSIFAGFKGNGLGQLAAQFEEAYEKEFELLFTEARQQKIIDLKIDSAIQRAIETSNQAMKSSAEIARESFGVLHGQPDLGSLFVGHYRHFIRNSTRAFTPQGQEDMQAYFYQFLEAFHFPEEIRDSLLKEYHKLSGYSEKIAYIRQFVLRIENKIEHTSKPQHQLFLRRIAAAEDYYVADSSIFAIHMGFGPGSENPVPQNYSMSWNPLSQDFEIADANEYHRRTLCVLGDDKIDYKERLLLLKTLSKALMDVAHTNHRAYAQDLSYKPPQNQLVLLGEKGAELLLLSLEGLQQRIPPEAGEPLVRDLCATLDTLERDLSALHTLKTTASFSEDDLKKLQKKLKQIRSVPVVKAWIEKAKQKEAEALRAHKSPHNKRKNRSLSQRLGRLSVDLQELRSEGTPAQPSQGQQRPKKTWLNSFTTKKEPTTIYEATLKHGLQEYNQLVYKLHVYSKALPNTIPLIEEKAGTKQLIVRHKIRAEEKIIHSVNENKLKIYLQPGSHPADWSIIHVMHEAVDQGLHLTANTNPALHTLIRVFHAALLYSEGHVHLHADDLARLEALDPSSKHAIIYQKLKSMSPEALKEHSRGQALGQLRDRPARKLLF